METSEKIAIGNKIKELREAKAEAQGTFAKAIGIKQAYLSLIENGERELSLDLAKKIAEYCNISLEEIITEGNVLKEEHSSYLPDCASLRMKCAMLEKENASKDDTIKFLQKELENKGKVLEMIVQRQGIEQNNLSDVLQLVKNQLSK